MRNAGLWDAEDAVPYDQMERVRKSVGAGSRLPTRSNRKAIATGNLRPRPPEHTNERHEQVKRALTTERKINYAGWKIKTINRF